MDDDIYENFVTLRLPLFRGQGQYITTFFQLRIFYLHPQTGYEWMKGIIAMSNSFVFANFTRASQKSDVFLVYI